MPEDGALNFLETEDLIFIIVIIIIILDKPLHLSVKLVSKREVLLGWEFWNILHCAKCMDIFLRLMGVLESV